MEKWAQSMNKKKSTITIGTKITQTTSSTTSLSASPFTSSSQTSKKAESSYMTELEMLAMKEEPEQDKKVLSRKRVTREHINLITRLLKLNKNTNYENVYLLIIMKRMLRVQVRLKCSTNMIRNRWWRWKILLQVRP
jgi:hypothetical protein